MTLPNPNTVTGHCYCGAVRFELTFPTEFCSHCHCEDCRQTHGSAFVTWTAVPLTQFIFLSGEDQLQKYESHPGIKWGFCKKCGTSVLYDCDDAPDKVYVTVSNLIGPLDRAPDAHVSFEEKVKWLATTDHLPKYLGKSDQVISPNSTNVFLSPIGVVKTTRIAAEDDHWDAVESRIELDTAKFKSSSLEGLAAFSHVEIIFYMDQVKSDKIEAETRHPRSNPEWPKVGIFAQRGKNRPNQIGTTICRIKRIEGTTLHLIGLDAIDGTPVLDIKPWVEEFGPRGHTQQPAWITELMKEYWA